MRNDYHKSKAFKEFKQKQFELSQRQKEFAKRKLEFKMHLIPACERQQLAISLSSNKKYK